MKGYELIAAGDPCGEFDIWVDLLKQSNIKAVQISIAEYDRQNGHTPNPHPRGNEVYVFVPAENLDEALKILKASIETENQS